MSIGIRIRFLAGRYHATPWNHQVNEGVVEWPPSPWRILRALVDAYYRLPKRPARAEVCQLLTCLAEQLPNYVLPATTTAHTRHYMPIWKEGKSTTTKVFDTFLLLGSGTLSDEAEVKVEWPDVSLSETETQLLDQLCAQISYLGRAESWAELSRIDVDPADCNAIPHNRQISSLSNKEQAKVLAPLTSEGMEGFRAALTTLPKPKRGKTNWQAPADVLEALELDVRDLHAQGWNGIPGARWITYSIPAQNPQRLLAPHQKVSFTGPTTYARFALASNVLPRLTEAVSVGERFRQALMSKSKDEAGRVETVFSGRDTDGKVSQNNHLHAWYLPEMNKDGKIEYVVVYAAEGFSQNAVSALKKLLKVWSGAGFDLQTVLISLGEVDVYRADATKPDQGGRSLVVGRGRVWRSYTPMVLPRHPKTYRSGEPKLDPETNLQIDGPEHQVRRLLKQVGCSHQLDAVCVRELSNEEQVPVFSKYPWHAYQRRRYKGDGSRGPNKGYWFELRFKEVQDGPIALGYAAHFGLGVFVPVS